MTDAGETKDGLEIVHFVDESAWRDWLMQNAEIKPGVWTKFAKKATGIESLAWAGAVDEALCFGWIDGQANKYDDQYYLQRFTPRRSRSKWSKINVGNVERLIVEGRMQPRGLVEVERAKADGRWEAAYDSPRTMEVPSDFQEALDSNPDAAAMFSSLNKTQRYSVLYAIHDAKRAETRARRIAKFVDQMAQGEKPA